MVKINEAMAKLFLGRKAKEKQKGGEFGACTVHENFIFWRTLQSLEYASHERTK